MHGADFVREHEPLILDTYEAYANQTARILGRAAPVVWLMEPDWHQYSEATQRGGGLSHSFMVSLFAAMVARIKQHLPASLISLDVSPWVSDVGEWMGRRQKRPRTPMYLLPDSRVLTSARARAARPLSPVSRARLRRLCAHIWWADHRRLGAHSRPGAGQPALMVRASSPLQSRHHR